eukprot:365052-Chlamydomonas_euryale.AAC.41
MPGQNVQQPTAVPSTAAHPKCIFPFSSACFWTGTTGAPGHEPPAMDRRAAATLLTMRQRCWDSGQLMHLASVFKCARPICSHVQVMAFRGRAQANARPSTTRLQGVYTVAGVVIIGQNCSAAEQLVFAPCTAVTARHNSAPHQLDPHFRGQRPKLAVSGAADPTPCRHLCCRRPRSLAFGASTGALPAYNLLY